MNKKLVIITSIAIFAILVVLQLVGFEIIETFSEAMRNLEGVFPEAFKGAVTVFGGIISFVVGRYLYERYQIPKVEIIKEDTIISLNNTVLFHRVIVRNKGRTAAKNCTGSIHLVGKDANGKTVDVSGGVCWSTIGNPGSITINVEDEQALDVYRVNNSQPNFSSFELPTEIGWRALRLGGILPLTIFSNAADLQFEVKITAENAKPYKKKYCLRKQKNDIILV